MARDLGDTLHALHIEERIRRTTNLQLKVIRLLFSVGQDDGLPVGFVYPFQLPCPQIMRSRHEMECGPWTIEGVQSVTALGLDQDVLSSTGPHEGLLSALARQCLAPDLYLDSLKIAGQLSQRIREMRRWRAGRV